MWGNLRTKVAQRVASLSAADLIAAERYGMRTGTVVVTDEMAMRNSVVWACLRIRADLMSTFPVDVYRKVNKQRIEVAVPPVLQRPGALFVGGKPARRHEWMYATQVDLDRCGNAFGLITARSAGGQPAQIDLVALSSVSVRFAAGVLSYRIGGVEYGADEVWHERQYVMAGSPVGLNPVMYAALALGEHASAQQLSLDWFGGSAIPAAHLRNTAKVLQKGQSRAAKDLFRATVESGDLFVTGSDWEFKPIQAVNAMTEYLEVRRHDQADTCRFFGVPGELVDAVLSGSAQTYANMMQKNLQFLIMHLGPAITRREGALDELVVAPRYVKLNRSALLAMDPETQARTLQMRIASRTLTPNEARALDDRLPLLDEQYAEFDRLFPAKATPPKTGVVPA